MELEIQLGWGKYMGCQPWIQTPTLKNNVEGWC